MTENRRKLFTTLFKGVISLFLIYFIFTKIDFKEVLHVLKSANWVWLVVAVFLFILSKVFNSIRLNLYFHVIGVPLTQLSNLKLYLLGMFYNLFLPGGIGGDAYKGYVIKKRFQVKIKTVVGALLLDRLSGMLLILIYACTFAGIMQKPFFFNGMEWLFWAVIPVGTFIFWIINKRLFSYALPVFWSSFGYSALLQFFQLGAAFCILKALGVTGNGLAYLFIFMISSIVSVIPLTIGGIGSREVTFLYGAKWLELDANSAIGISFVFFLITALVSLFGVGYHFKKPQLESVIP